jgi:hypothetical protein
MNKKLSPLNSIFALSIVVLSGIPGLAQTSVAIDVNDPRPLAAAVTQLEKQVGIGINFEDMPYTFAGDLKDVTATAMTQSQRSANPGVAIIVPRGGPLTIAPVSLANNPASVSGVTAVLASLVGAYATAGYPGVYSSTYAHGAFFITPAQVHNSAGNAIAFSPILDTTVTLPSQARSAGDTLEAILQQVKTQTGIPVEIGQVPNGLMINAKITIGANNESARSVIARAFSMLAAGKMADGSTATLMSYRLFFDPQLKYYVFNVHGVQPLTGPLPSIPAITSAGAPNPYMRKN